MNYSNLKTMQDLWEQSLTAKTISVPLVSFLSNDNIEEALTISKEKNYDVVGVRDKNGCVIGYINIADVETGTCGENCLSFGIQDLVSLQTPLKECLIKIENRDRLFVLANKGVNQIITLADLYKQPVRMLLFSLISLIEMSMTDLIQLLFPNDDWQTQICHTRLDKPREIFDDRQRKNQECDLIDCLQICDKSQILIKNEYSEKWEFESKKQAKSFFKDLNDLRDNLAHSQKIIWDNISELIAIHSKAEEVLEVNVQLLSKSQET